MGGGVGRGLLLSRLVSLVVWTLLGVPSRRAIAFTRVQEIVMRVSAAILVAFGVRLAFDR